MPRSFSELGDKRRSMLLSEHRTKGTDLQAHKVGGSGAAGESPWRTAWLSLRRPLYLRTSTVRALIAAAASAKPASGPAAVILAALQSQW